MVPGEDSKAFAAANPVLADRRIVFDGNFQNYTAAIKTLTRSKPWNDPSFGGESPHNLVFLAPTPF
jgi:hypothetical protein